MIWETLPGWCGPENDARDQHGADGIHLDVALLQREANKVRLLHVMVEIGSWCGRSAFVLHEGNPHVALHCYDPYTKGLVEDGAFGVSQEKALETFLTAIEKCCVRPVVVESGPLPARAVDHPGIFLHVEDSIAGGRAYTGPPVALLHVDGLHTYEQVRDELRAWLPHLIEDPAVIFDDWLSYDGDIQRGAWEVLHCSEWEVRERGYGRFLLGRRS